MFRLTVPVLYLLFFLSGAAALVYQVVWVRCLSLVFGGSHLAVTTVLSVFMGGLALGGWLIGRRVDRWARPLRLYGLLEIGIAVFAFLFLLLAKLYPYLYVPLVVNRQGIANTLTLPLSDDEEVGLKKSARATHDAILSPNLDEQISIGKIPSVHLLLERKRLYENP